MIDALIYTIGTLFSLGLIYCAFAIRQQSYRLRASLLLSEKESSSRALVSEALPEKMLDHFVVSLNDKVSPKNKFDIHTSLKARKLFEQEINAKIFRNTSSDFQLIDILNAISIIEKANYKKTFVRNLNKRADDDLIRTYASTYVVILDVVLNRFPIENRNYPVVRHEELIEFDNFKLLLKEGKTGIENITVG